MDKLELQKLAQEILKEREEVRIDGVFTESIIREAKIEEVFKRHGITFVKPF